MSISKKTKFKGILILVAIGVLAVVSFFYPEHTEIVARAFMLLIGGV